MSFENDNSSGVFSHTEWLRYTRHIQLPQFGAAGQTALKKSHALVIGAGGLGSPVSLYLAAAGVGSLTLVDHDAVDLSNLQRQILFRQKDIEKNKALSGQKHLQELNPELDIRAIDSGFNIDNAEALVSRADIVLDCTDNFATRYLINDTCQKLSKPWVYASIHQFTGQCSLFSKSTGCFRCLFPEHPQEIPDCNSAGVIGVLPGILGTLQASEALKFLTGMDTPLQGSLLLFDALKLNMQKIKLAKSPDCPCCSKHASTAQQLAQDYQSPTCGTDIDPLAVSTDDFIKLKNSANYLVLDVRSEPERRAFNIGGLHIPLDQLELRKAEVSIDSKVICYCQSGQRSSKAAELLSAKGFSAQSLAGGLMAYLKKVGINHQ